MEREREKEREKRIDKKRKIIYTYDINIYIVNYKISQRLIFRNNNKAINSL